MVVSLIASAAISVGLATPALAETTSLPMVSLGGSSFSQVGCGLRTDAQAVCFGASLTPPTGTFTQLSTGDAVYVCGVRTDATVACAGDSYVGSPPSGTFTQVSGGGYVACGVRTNQALACWTTVSGLPDPPTGTFTQVSSGVASPPNTTAMDACAVRTSGAVACWGDDNTYGQLTPPSGTFSQVSVGNTYACGLKTNGSIACWGRNDNGQASPPAGSFTQVSSGAGFHVETACGLHTDGTVACWGYDDQGSTEPPGGTFTQISAGTTSVCGVRPDKSVSCWGDMFNLGDVPSLTPDAPVITSSASATFTVGQSGSKSLVATGSPDPTFSLSGAPAWLSVSSTGAGTATLSGTPPPGANTSSPYSFTVTAHNANGPDATQTFTLTVAAGTTAVTVTAPSPSITYGGTVPSLTPSYSGGVMPTTGATCSTSATSASGVGTYPVTCSGAADPRYTFSYVAGTVTISRAPLTVTASSASINYGAAVPAITPSYAGFVHGETAAALTTAPTCSTTATSSSPVGSYPSTCSGAVAANYTISYVAGAVTVTGTNVNVTAPSPSIVYGAALPTLTPTYSGGVTPTGAATCSTTATATSGKGTYPVTCSGASDPAHTFTYTAGTLTITRALLTITASSASKVYGAAVPTITPSYAGFVNGDTVADLTTAPSCATFATASSDFGSYLSLCSAAVATNYTISYVGGTVTVTKAPLTITASSASKVYGAAVATITPSYAGFVNGDDAADLTTAPTCSTTATSTSPVGPYPSKCSGAAAGNYTISYVGGTVTVTKAPLTITASSASKVYGAAVPTITPSYSGFVNGDNSADLTTPPQCATFATAGSGFGSYLSLCSAATAANYTISYVGGTVTVTKAPLTITASSASMVYGGTVPTIVASYIGFVNGDTSADLTAIPSCSTTATSGSPVGSYPSTCSGAVAANYTISYVAGTITIGTLAVTVTAPSPSMVYGGTVPSLAPTYSGGVAPATSATCSVNATSASNAGTYPVTCSGAADARYTFSYIAGTLTITRAALTVTASNGSMVYGGTVPTITASYNGFVNGDTTADLTVAPSCSTTATSGSPVGSYPSTCSGAVAGNYTLSYVAGAVGVTRAALTITASSASMVYGGLVPTIVASYSGFVNGDTSADLTTTPSCSTTATSTSPVGPYPSMCSGAVDANYTISYVAGTVTIGTLAVTVTAPSPSTVYGGTVPSLEPTYSGGVTPMTTAASCSVNATSASNAGTYPVTCSGAADPRYTFSYVAGTLTITRAALTVTASNGSFVYGGTVPTITATYAGLVNGDTAADLTTAPSCSTTATSGSPVGSYPSTCSGAVTGNYTISYVAGTVGVTRAALTITASDASMVYGDTVPTITATYAGFVNGDTAADLTTAPSCSTTATSGSPVNTYPTTCSDTVDGNYTVSYVPGTLSVTPAALTITASDDSMVYGDTVPTITPSYAGFVNGDGPGDLTTAAICSTTATSTSAVGSYPSSCGGAASSNYTFSYVDGTVTVTRALLTITASDASKVYGDTVPTITPDYAGFVNGDGPADLATAAVCTTTATATSPVAEYPSSCSGATSSGYTISYVDGTVTVTPVALTITASDASMVYGGTVPTISPVYDGFVNGDDPADLTTAPTCSTTATAASPVGAYSSSCSGAVAANYTISYVDGTVTVTAAATTVTAADQTVVIGPGATGPWPVHATLDSAGAPLAGRTITFTAGGQALCDATTSADGTATCNLGRQDESTLLVAGTYVATFSGDANYAGSHDDASATVTVVVPGSPPSSDGVLKGVPAEVHPGQKITVTATGYAPNSPVTFAIYSSPVRLGQATSDLTGSITITLRIPAGLSGHHTVVAAGRVDPLGARYLEAGTLVVPVPVSVPVSDGNGTTGGANPAAGTVAETGPSVDLLASLEFALVCLLGGAGLLAVSRRRPRDSRQ